MTIESLDKLDLRNLKPEVNDVPSAPRKTMIFVAQQVQVYIQDIRSQGELKDLEIVVSNKDKIWAKSVVDECH